MTAKRKVEVFSAGCPACADVKSLVKSPACPSCEVEVLDMRDISVAQGAGRALGAGGGDQRPTPRLLRRAWRR